MTDALIQESGRAQGTYPPRSKMLDMYAAHIAGLLAEGRHESAEREAMTIPHIAVALADAGLQSSSAGYREWCSKWLQPDFGSEIYDEWFARSSEHERSGSGVPFAALRALRLGRRARETPTLYTRLDAKLDAGKAQSITCALLGAGSRWYEQEGRYQKIVQTNLARLGVLR
jgi:hypothetical protein